MPRIDHRWPGRPGLLPDESFSSWFARTAVANGLRPSELYRIVQPGEDRNPRDLDRYADDHLIDRLADCTGIDVDRLRRATFRRWEGLLFDHDYGDRKLAWLPPAGRLNGKRCFGQQACPMCLAGGHEPFLRQIWRLSFVTTYPVHGCLLLDRCQHCNEPFSVLRQDSKGEIACWSCGADVACFTSDEAPVDAREVQRDLLGFASQGWWPMGEYGAVYSFAAFDVLAALCRLLASGRHALGLRAWVADREAQLAFPPQSVPRAREGALLAPKARNILVPMAYWLMTDWPHRFVAAANAVGLTSRDLLKKADQRYPFAFAHVVEWSLRAPEGRRATTDELLAARQAVCTRGQPATARNLISLIGAKPAALASIAEPAVVGAVPWGKGRYWKLDGVSPEVKAAARIAAHRAGEGVGPWLDALLRRELGIPARKTPCPRPSPDTFAADGISGCAEYTTRRLWKCKGCGHQFSASGTIFAGRKLAMRDYLLAIAIFCNGAKGVSALQLSRDLDVQYKTAFVLAHKLREAMAAEDAGAVVSGEVEIDGAYFGGYVKPANWKENRRDRRLRKNQNGRRRVVIVARERNGKTLTFVVKSEDAAVPTIHERVAPGSTIHADEAPHWDQLHARYLTKRINHSEVYSDGESCTNQAESFFTRR